MIKYKGLLQASATVKIARKIKAGIKIITISLYALRKLIIRKIAAALDPI